MTVEVTPGGALVFPHARLAESGRLVAAAALAVVRSGRAEVLALGVLHGGRERDRERVEAARAGDPATRAALRRVHGPGAPGDSGHWTEEFSLDGFSALIELAARRAGRPAPRLVARYPFLVGGDPAGLPGVEELAAGLERGAALVATTDPIHHGAGYGTPPGERLDAADPATVQRARESVERSLELAARREWAAFQAHTAACKSDFRDTGPVLATLLAGPDGSRPLAARLVDLVLVDYAEALGAERPTWVAAALAEMGATSRGPGTPAARPAPRRP